MTQSNAEQPAEQPEPHALGSEQSAAHDSNQPAWNSTAQIAAPEASHLQSFDPPQLPMPPQPLSFPAPAAQYQQQPPAAPQYQNYPPAPPQYQAPAAQQHFPGQYPQMSQQPPMPNPAYGYPQPKSKLAAGLLGIFLGGLGIHRFYLGYTTIGVIQIILTVLLGIFTFGLVGLWGLIEGIMILAGASYFQRDANGIPLRE
ncbi:TM2 domain-containing membrane protein YozV [Pseudarthrobacter siccitolerans]|uniref:TM2 domain-containing membrane protein YozV n=2 Tax=Pseudarthrobacter siccitolerans TaxID=861266 RepID=A0ABU0PS56_9MICC|nr:TM2 domain-containing membrane protein YozV [Pseudarthrobacter siccitolerans]